MNNRQQLRQGVTWIAVAYLFLHIDITVGINWMPDWVGYGLLYRSLFLLTPEEPEARLLEVPALLLAAWEFLVWVGTVPGWNLNVPAVAWIMTVLALYFHFQLLTDLARIAGNYRCPEQRRLLRLRTGRTILGTLCALPWPWETVQMILLAVYMGAVIWICQVLFSLRRSLRGDG